MTMPKVSCIAVATQNSSEWPCSMCPFPQLRLVGVRTSYIYCSSISWTPWVLDPMTNPYLGYPCWRHPVTVSGWFKCIIFKLTSCYADQFLTGPDQYQSTAPEVGDTWLRRWGEQNALRIGSVVATSERCWERQQLTLPKNSLLF